MKEKMTTLGKSCQFFNGKAHEKYIDAEGQFVVVNSKFISTNGEVKKFTAKQMFPLLEKDIVMVMSDVPNGKALAKCYIIEENDKYSLNQRICAIRSTEFNVRFLYYQLNRHPYLLAFNNGENQTNLRKGDILNCPLWKPSLEEQKQIVAILDKAFAAIDQAKTNIEKNIANAQELFQSKLNEIFSQKGEGWTSERFSILFKLKSGNNLTAKNMVAGQYPVFGGNGIAGYHNDYNCQNPEIIIGRVGALCGNVRVVNEKFWLTDNAFKIVSNLNNFDLDFVVYMLNFKNLRSYARQAAQPVISNSSLKDVKITYPIQIEKQKLIVKQLNHLKEETINIKSHYHQKLTNLEELKKSILQKAFSGQLSEPVMK